MLKWERIPFSDDDMLIAPVYSFIQSSKPSNVKVLLIWLWKLLGPLHYVYHITSIKSHWLYVVYSERLGASQNNFCRTEDVRWPCKGKLCGLGGGDWQPMLWHVEELEKECTEREGISDIMIAVIWIIIVRGVGGGSNGGEESNDCLEGVVPFQWKIHVSELWKFISWSFTVVYIVS
jgi:hypothetical protein